MSRNNSAAAASKTKTSTSRRSGEYRPLTSSERVAKQEEAARKRLQGILEPDRIWPFWSAYQASWYFVGIDPDATIWSDGPEASLLAKLPGVPRDSSSSSHIHEMHLEDWHAKVSELIQGSPQTPVAWIREWLAKGLRPVWLDAALADTLCRSLLPDDLVRKCGVRPDGTKRQVAAAHARYGQDVTHKTVLEHRDDFVHWTQSGAHLTETGTLRRGAIRNWCIQVCDVAREKYGEEIRPQRMYGWAKRWLKELNDGSRQA